VEDEVLIAESIQEMLMQLGYKSIQRCKTQKDAEEIIEIGNLSMAILDINLAGGQEGIELGKKCAKKGIPYFFLTSYSDRGTLLTAKSANPGNYLIKPTSPEEILAAIEMTLLHQRPENDLMLEKAVDTFQLSNREAEILKYINERLSNQEISDKLFVSLNTIKFHLKHIYAKLGVSTKQEAVELVKLNWVQKD